MKTIEINSKEYPTYATIEEADDYFAAFYGSVWHEIDDEDKKKLLVSASRNIDYGEWRGRKVDEDQKQAFPRIINGKETDETLLMIACCEEALGIYQAGSSGTANTDGIASVKVQDTQITFKSNATEQEFHSDTVEDILRPYRYLGVSVLY